MVKVLKVYEPKRKPFSCCGGGAKEQLATVAQPSPSCPSSRHGAGPEIPETTDVSHSGKGGRDANAGADAKRIAGERKMDEGGGDVDERPGGWFAFLWCCRQRQPRR